MFLFISTASNTSSRLLRLPQELKNIIYGLVFGVQLIHMSWDRYWQKWIRRLCRAKISEKEAHKRFVASKVSTCSPDPVYRHNDCWGPPCRSLYAHLNLALLSCCRQIYLEAHPIFISANTWSITMSWVFKMFYLESQIPPTSV